MAPGSSARVPANPLPAGEVRLFRSQLPFELVWAPEKRYAARKDHPGATTSHLRDTATWLAALGEMELSPGWTKIVAKSLGIIPTYDIMRDMIPEELLPLSPQVFQILVALAGADQHGYAMMHDVAARSNGKIRLSPGTLYGCIHRMLEQGLVVELDAKGDERRRFYRLTPFGRKVAKAEAARLAESLEQARIYGLAPKLS